MSGFTLYSSNDQRELLSVLANKIRTEPLVDPLEAEKIVVHSHGMQRWVSMELAKQLGILANAKFLFPNEFLNQSYQAVLDDFTPNPLPDKDRLIWQLLTVLENSEKLSRFSDLTNYLDAAEEYKRFQFTKRLAGLLDQYCMFRPDWILDWERSDKDHWQAGIWKELQQLYPSKYKPHFQEEFREKIDTAQITSFANRVSIFGISSLPPIHIELIYHLSRHIPVDMYFLNPSKQYWVDVLSKKTISRIQRERPSEELYLFEGNSLFSATAKAGQEFYHQLIDKNLIDDYGEDFFVKPANPETLLQHIQKDIYDLDNPQGEIEIDPSDRSIQIHNCHSPMREVEVLHDQILHLLDTDSNLEPDEIVVMCPDIEDYSAYIKAIFTAGEQNTSSIPFSIADRSLRFESKSIEYFFKLLDLIKSRVSVTEVMELLDYEPLRRKFKLTEPEIERVDYWVREANIRWGIDGDFRSKFGIPPTYETTWEFGIDRILTGYAMPLGEEGYLSANGSKIVLPFDDIEGIDALSFGKFLELFYRLEHLITQGPYHQQARLSLEEWSSLISNLLDNFFDLSGDGETEFDTLTQTLADLSRMGKTFSNNLTVEFETIYAYLQSKLLEQRSGLGFLGSGVTFCSMLPMRSIPFKVIVLLGMNDRIFPRVSSPLSFDLMANSWCLGDRSIKNEDQYIFLEAILSAQQTLLISYVGQSINDNKPIPPSTLVSELKYYIGKGYQVPDAKTKKNHVQDHIEFKHPLQAFNPKYFDTEAEKWFSFSQENLLAAQEMIQEKKPIQPFITSLPSCEALTLTADELAGFFENSSRYLLNNRLTLFLNEFEEGTEDQESFSLNFLHRFLMQSELLEQNLENEKIDKIRGKYLQKGLLPLSNAGNLHFNEIKEETETIFQKLAPFKGQAEAREVAYDVEFDGVRLQGKLEDIFGNQLTRCRPSRLRAKDRIKIWIEQLLFQITTGEPATSVLIMKNPKYGKSDKSIELYTCEEIQDPTKYLQILLHYLKKGLLAPLPFFPQTTLVYLEETAKGPAGDPSAKSKTAWYGESEFLRGELENPYVNLCFRHLDLFETGFEKIGSDILGPILDSQVKVT